MIQLSIVVFWPRLNLVNNLFMTCLNITCLTFTCPATWKHLLIGGKLGWKRASNFNFCQNLTQVICLHHVVIGRNFRNLEIRFFKIQNIGEFGLTKEDLHRKLDFSVILLLQTTSAGMKWWHANYYLFNQSEA